MIDESKLRPFDLEAAKRGERMVRSAVSLELSGASSYLNDIRQEAYFHIGQVASAMQLPSAIYRPRIFMDGNKWCALYGENIQEGVAGFGDSPQEAMMDFDANWIKEGCWMADAMLAARSAEK